MFPSVSPYMSEDDLVNYLRSQLQLIANQRGMLCQYRVACGAGWRGGWGGGGGVSDLLVTALGQVVLKLINAHPELKGDQRFNFSCFYCLCFEDRNYKNRKPH